MKLVKLGEVCKFFNGKAHEKKIDINGKFIVVNSKCISSNFEIQKFSNEQLFPLFKNDIVMVMSDVPNGKALAKCVLIEEDKKYSLNQRIACIRSDNFYIPYLLYQLDRNPYFLKFDNGENQTNLRKADILNCPLYLPSIEEQQRIVAKLDVVFTEIDKMIKDENNKMNYAKQLLIKYLETQILNQNKLLSVDKVCEVLDHLRIPITKRFREKGQFPYFGATGIKDYVKDFIFDEKLVLLGEDGAKWDKGEKTAFIADGKYWVNNHAHVLRPIKDLILHEWLVYYFYITDLKPWVTGMTVPKLNKEKMLSIKIPTPSIKIQKEKIKRIFQFETSHKEVIKLINKKIDSFKTLKSSILYSEFK